MSNPFYVDVQPMHSGVTGSSFHIKVVFPSRKTRTFLVDCGMIQEEEYHELAEEPLPRMLINAEALILTHNHIDHIGQVPLLVRDGFRGPIYCTEPTSKCIKESCSEKERCQKRKKLSEVSS